MPSFLDKTNKKKQTSLETANAMFKDAFALIKHRFRKQYPQFSEEELSKKTARYFKELPNDGKN